MKLPAEFTCPVKIGTGSFASVYRVRQRKLQRNVALKIIPVGNKRKNSIITEAHLLASAGLSCAPHIFDIRQSGASVIIVMEWIYGIPLSLLLKQTLVPDEKTVIAADVISACAMLHKNDLVHRDLKPGNVIVTPDRGVMLVDFGFSCTTTVGEANTASGLRGTPAYMAPELWKSGDETINLKKIDLYALGTMVHDILGDNCPSIVLRCMHHNPEARPADAVELDREWKTQADPVDRDRFTTHMTQAAAAHTSDLLYRGACELSSRRRQGEAYALLTESIRLWPDNTEALELLQNRFSTPLASKQHHRSLVQSVTVLLLCSIIAGAYLMGRESTKETPYPDSPFGTPARDERTLLTHPSGGAALPLPVSISLRGSGGTSELSATLTILVASGHGTVFVNGERINADDRPAVNTEMTSHRIDLPAGTHRIEWYDSTSNRLFAETVDLVPFSCKTISLVRFTHDH